MRVSVRIKPQDNDKQARIACDINDRIINEGISSHKDGWIIRWPKGPSHRDCDLGQVIVSRDEVVIVNMGPEKERQIIAYLFSQDLQTFE